MSLSFFFKGLSAEERIFPQTIDSSLSKAKGTLYEAWFDVLQASPWYRNICETGDFPSQPAELTWKHFGDLRNQVFEDWWKNIGYKIFAEAIPYRPIELLDLKIDLKKSKNEKKPPTLKIEVPLNLAPHELRRQFDQILRAHEVYANEFDRWDFSTAAVHQERETKLTYSTIKNWLTVYKEYERQKNGDGFALYNFAKEQELHPQLFKGLPKNRDVPEDLRIKASNVASDILKKVSFLMANATELSFPNTDPHDWAISIRRSR